MVVVGAALALDLTHALQRLEYTSVNERFTIRGQQKPPSDVVVVAIDDKTFDGPGRALARSGASTTRR